MSVLLLGATGNIGHLVCQGLLERNLDVRVIVRSAAKLGSLPRGKGKLTAVEANILELSPEQLQEHLKGCNAVVSCLGHDITFQGIFGPPTDLVLRAMDLICKAIEQLHPPQPIKFIHLNTIGVSHPDSTDPPRGLLENALVWLLSRLLPPYRDSYNCAQYLYHQIGLSHPFIQWCAVRPDSFKDGAVSKYRVYQQLQTRILAPGESTKANTAHFACELVLNPALWEQWQYKMPTILDDEHAPAA